MTAGVVLVVSYLLGSIPVAVLVARARGFDPRSVGDRNPGYWNMKEQVGARAAVPVFVGDALKGLAAGLLAVVLLDGWGWGYGAVAAAMIGHAWPVFAGFRGGRSILTFAGGMLAIAPLTAAIAVAALAVTLVVTRSFAYAARVAVFGAPVAQLLVDPVEHVAATGALMTIIGVRFAIAALAARSA